jgi:pyrroline-5-carboxylate reductase
MHNSSKSMGKGMTMTKTIVFIGGGQMAGALIKGLLQSGEYTAGNIEVVEPDAARRSSLETSFGVVTSDSAATVLSRTHVVVLAVKPQVMAEVLHEIKPLLTDQLVITIAAGLCLSFYTAILGEAVPVVRVMPNISALALEGASALARNSQVREEDLAFAAALFSAVGSTSIVEEKVMDAVTGLSGSGPAYVFTFIEALIDGGVKSGLSHEVATRLAVQTVLGAARLVQTTDEHPAVLRARVSSPGGTTIHGLHALEKGGFRGIVMDAVAAATERSAQLGTS